MSDTRYISPNQAEVADQILDGEAILINLATGMYYSMTGSGGGIWALIKQGSSIDFIVSSISDRFSVDRDQVERDVTKLVSELEGEGLVVVSSTGSNPPAAAAEGISEPEYQAPKLEKFTDMAEMFALDPPLPGLADGEK